MKVLDVATIIRGAFALKGMASHEAQEVEVLPLYDVLAEALPYAWELYRWPDLCEIDLRYYYLGQWTAREYDEGAIVYQDGEYWIVLDPVVGPSEKPGVSNGWGLAGEPMRRVVPFEQAGKAQIGQLYGAFEQDPRVYANAPEVGFRYLDSYGIDFMTRRPGVWLYYRRAAPRLDTASAYASATTYARGDIVYTGKPRAYYQSRADGNTGNAPSSSPASWEAIGIPLMFGSFLKHALYAALLRGEGQASKRVEARREAEALLEKEIWKLVHQSGQRPGVRVQK